jgi:hypothetical protein
MQTRSRSSARNSTHGSESSGDDDQDDAKSPIRGRQGQKSSSGEGGIEDVSLAAP